MNSLAPHIRQQTRFSLSRTNISLITTFIQHRYKASTLLKFTLECCLNLRSSGSSIKDNLHECLALSLLLIRGCLILSNISGSTGRGFCIVLRLFRQAFHQEFSRNSVKGAAYSEFCPVGLLDAPFRGSIVSQP